MVNFNEPVTTTIIVTTIIAIFVTIGLGILAVKTFKKESK